MSYILDALLKADQERQRSAAPTLNSVHVTGTIAATGPHRRWPNLALLALLGGSLLAGGALFVLRPPAAKHLAETPRPQADAPALTKNQAWRGSQDGRAVPPRQDRERTAPASQTPPLPTTTAEEKIAPPAAVQPSPPPLPSVAKIRRETPSAEERHHSKAPVPTQPAVTEAAAAATTAPAPAEPTPSANLKRSNRVIDFGELPAELRKEVEQNVTVAGASFSADNNERMAIINDRARRAGDEVAAGVKLESILPDGIILNYKGYRFRTGMY
ncbi:general secretion pathway protein GspB [Pseudogulbenkiania subflava]|uniref:General secretion pathway protein B n=1 Tax=Pseudogulbenkiania subflava DSM 22618 TaxID=1123014 RepID=A0A1Y6BVD1_9NEIS|nr:general secretion pathway protein GspB [Pseudogulbenkiania subflava]SMF30665.1 general secretion pathway protein B [Pseudogulbenkiania subflava DSM 22618]